MKSIITGLCWMLIIIGSGFAQPVCGFDQANQMLQSAVPYFSLRQSDNEQKIDRVIRQRRSIISSREEESNIFTIPIVVHVLTVGDTVGSITNPADGQILAAIAYLNEIYSGTHPSLTPAGNDAAGDIGLRFVLAQRDPDCNPTTGIHRVDMSLDSAYVAFGATNQDLDIERAMKAPIVWDRTRYYNIYLVHKINGQDGTSGQFTAGYAYYPTNSIVDGTVLLASQMKPGSKTLVHEIGHAFFLYHTFQGSSNKNKCPTGNGDFVDDTDPVSFNVSGSGKIDFTCRTGNNPCVNRPYNIRTESNFMSYTNCYTLFTPGQRERIRASILLEERNSLILSNGGLATNASPACTPKINFERSFAEVYRTTTESVDCMKYTDYYFNLTIGADPKQETRLILQIDTATNAIENSDFSFIQGKAITFPAGSDSSRSFGLRIFNNGSSPTKKLLRLGFLIDSEGGIAEIGTANPILDVEIAPADYSPVVPGKKSVAQIGEISELTIAARIFNPSLLKQKTQILYRAEELKKAGIVSGSSLTGIRFFLKKKSRRPLKNVTISLAQTQLDYLVSDKTIQYAQNLTSVFTSESYTTVQGWNNFEFSSPFEWNGISHIAVELCFNNESAEEDEADDVYVYGKGSHNKLSYMIDDESVDCSLNFSLVNDYKGGGKPVVIFDYALSGNQVESIVSESAEEYLGPFDEIFFYDKSSSPKIIASIKNLTSWDYGCTKVRIDRAGTDAVNFSYTAVGQYVARKTFFAEAQHKNDSGKYEIKLYYTAAEKSGFEFATGKNWKNIGIIKTKVPVSSGTAEVIGRQNISINTEVIHESYGNDYVVGGTFDNGLSGFTVGAVAIALPVNWLDFQVVETKGGVRLDWATFNEHNNRFFEVQKSADGVNFTPVHTLPAKGGENIKTDYSYVYLTSETGKIFFRIKQVDYDGKQGFSEVRIINLFNDSDGVPSLYPIPARDYFRIDFKKAVSEVYIEILSADLKLFFAEKVNEILKEKIIYTNRLAAGTYFVRITTGDNRYVQKMIKL